MMACEDLAAAVRVGRVSLVLPVLPGGSLSAASLSEYRWLLEADGSFDSVEVIVAGAAGHQSAPGAVPETGNGDSDDSAIYVAAEGAEWSAIVRGRGLRRSHGRSPRRARCGPPLFTAIAVQVVAPVRTDRCDVAVAVPWHDGRRLSGWGRPGAGFGGDQPIGPGHVGRFAASLHSSDRSGTSPATMESW